MKCVWETLSVTHEDECMVVYFIKCGFKMSHRFHEFICIYVIWSFNFSLCILFFAIEHFPANIWCIFSVLMETYGKIGTGKLFLANILLYFLCAFASISHHIPYFTHPQISLTLIHEFQTKVLGQIQTGDQSLWVCASVSQQNSRLRPDEVSVTLYHKAAFSVHL